MIPNDHPMLLFPKLARVIGQNEAIILAQLRHLLEDIPDFGKMRNGKRWLYFTHTQLHEKIFPFMSISTIRRAIDSLEAQSLLFCEIRRDGANCIGCWYALNPTGEQILTEERCAGLLSTPVQNEQTPSVQIEQTSAQNEQVQTETSAETSSSENPSSPQGDNGFVEEILGAWKEKLPKLVQPRSIDDTRKRNLSRFWDRMHRDIEDVRALFDLVRDSDFLAGHSGVWEADLWWVIKPANAAKIIDGNYDNKLSR